MNEALLERFRQGDRLALARLLTLASHGEFTDQLASPASIRGLTPPARQSPAPALVVAITGSGGVGKSTLIGKLIDYLRKQGESVAVLACDPQSPRTGGALLGDRFRMSVRAEDEGVFIRSIATESGQGAIARNLDVMIQLLAAFGFDVILIETVGAGQGDTAARDLADVLVLLLQPETGDELQWEKAGILEVADVVVIHKADLPGAEHVESQVKSSLELSAAPTAAVVRVSSRNGEGIDKLWQLVRDRRGSQRPA